MLQGEPRAVWASQSGRGAVDGWKAVVCERFEALLLGSREAIECG